MASGEITVKIVDADSFAALADLLERMEDGEVWSVDLACEELRSIMEGLKVNSEHAS